MILFIQIQFARKNIYWNFLEFAFRYFAYWVKKNFFLEEVGRFWGLNHRIRNYATLQSLKLICSMNESFNFQSITTCDSQEPSHVSSPKSSSILVLIFHTLWRTTVSWYSHFMTKWIHLSETRTFLIIAESAMQVHSLFLIIERTLIPSPF